jgi:hypothetical protein
VVRGMDRGKNGVKAKGRGRGSGEEDTSAGVADGHVDAMDLS